MISATEKLKAFFRSAQERVVDGVRRHPIFIKELTPENREKVEYVKYLLERNPQLILVTGANHGSDNDGPALAQATRLLMPEGMDDMYIMVSQGRSGNSPVFRRAVSVGNVFDTHPIPVVQGKTIKNLKKRETAIMKDQDEIAEEWAKVNQDLKKTHETLTDLRSSSKRLALGMLWEGTRRPRRILKPLSEGKGAGITADIGMLSPALVVPIALYPDDYNKTERTSFGLYRLRAEIGYPMVSLSRDNPVSYFDVMIQTAKLLPERYRGEWQPLLEEWENPNAVGLHG